jgi:hypothetical protein
MLNFKKPFLMNWKISGFRAVPVDRFSGLFGFFCCFVFGFLFVGMVLMWGWVWGILSGVY